MNMGIDEAILEAVAEGSSPPTVRFYTWNRSAVSIGRFQKLEEVVNLERCREEGVDVVRRITGGGAVYHDSQGEITYSIAAPVELISKDITKSYEIIGEWISKALGYLGINASFQPINDITVEGKKISGSAQTRRRGALLQHGTILYRLKPELMFSVLKISKEKISDKLIKKVEDRVTSVSKLKNVSFDEVAHALWRGFSEGKDYFTGDLSKEELRRAEALASNRYSSYDWLALR